MLLVGVTTDRGQSCTFFDFETLLVGAGFDDRVSVSRIGVLANDDDAVTVALSRVGSTRCRHGEEKFSTMSQC